MRGSRTLLYLSLSIIQGTLAIITCPTPFNCKCTVANSALVLDCSDRHLRSVPDLGLLQDLPISSIDLSKNTINVIENRAFQSLHFTNNKRSENKLVLSHNPIGRIDTDAFSGIHAPWLQLELGNCTLRSFPIDALVRVVNLTNIIVNDNKFRSLDASLFEGLTKVKAITLSGNKVRILNEGVFEPIRNTIEHLYLRDMALTEFPTEALRDLPNLRSVAVTSNFIRSIPSNLLHVFESKEKYFNLDASKCGIEYVSKYAFNRSDTSLSISKLDLRNNDIRETTFLSDYCSTIFGIDGTIKLNGNPLRCTCEFIDIMRIGYFSLYGTCDDPLELRGNSFEVWHATESNLNPAGNGRFQLGFDLKADSLCGPANFTTTDNLHCNGRYGLTSSATKNLTQLFSSFFLFIAFIFYTQCCAFRFS